MSSETPERSALRILRHPLVVGAALIIGVVLGLLARKVGPALKPIGEIYLLLLEMTVLPIVILAITNGVATLVQQRGTLRLVIRTVLVVMLFLLAAGAVGLCAALIARPGSRMSTEEAAVLSNLIRLSPQGADTAVAISGSAALRSHGSALDALVGIVPRNIFASLSAGTILQAMLFSLIVGLAIGLLRDKQREYLLGLAQSALAAFRTLNRWLIYFLPFGVVCLVSSQVAAANTLLLPVLSEFLLTLVAAIVGASLLLSIVVWRRSGTSPGVAAAALVEPLAYAFITGSSLVALPYSLRALEDRLGFRAERVQATLPITAAVGRYGIMLTFVLAASFIANFYGVPWSVANWGTLLLFAAAGAIASAGASGAAALGMVGVVFAPLGLPVEPIVVIFAAAGFVLGPVLAAFETHAAVAAATIFARSPKAAAVRAHQRRLLSIRVTILTLVASLVILTGGVTIGLMYSGQRRNIAYLANAMIRDISARVVQRTTNYLSPAERTAESLRYLFGQGVLDVRNRNALISVMRNAMENNPEFAAVYFGDTTGDFTMVKRMPDGSLSNRLITRSRESVAVDWQHANSAYAAGFPDSTESLAQGYDPRSRGWYRNAVAARDRVWTDVYLFASDNMLGISDAVPLYGSGTPGAAPLMGVAAVDIGLAELSYFLGSLDISATGKAFIVNEKDQLVALSMQRGSDLSALFAGKATGSAASTANLVPADEAGDPLVREAFLTYLRNQRNPGSFSFREGRARYISAINAFPSDEFFQWKIGIVIPESEIYGFVNDTSRIVLAAAVLIIIVAIGIGVNFSRSVTNPLQRLSLEMERIRNFDLSSQERTESRIAEIHTMAESFANMKHGLSAFNKYVPSKLVAELIRLGEEPRIGGQRKNLTILFSDIADFTAISESLTPEKLMDEMAVYLGALGNAIMRNRGTVDKYIGDAIMALWNAPGDVADHEVQACLAALECQGILAEMRRKGGRASTGGVLSVFTKRTRMGIHSGEVIVGNMGSEERLSYTAVGDSVNLASRLEGLNKFYGTTIIVSETTYAAAKKAVTARLVDRVAVKGRSGGIEIYELMGRRDRITLDEGRFIELATKGVRRYLDGDFAGAIALAREALGIRQDDPALRIILQRCEDYLRVPPPKDWKGVFVHHAK